MSDNVSSSSTVVPKTPPQTGPPGDPPDPTPHDTQMDDTMHENSSSMQPSQLMQPHVTEQDNSTYPQPNTQAAVLRAPLSFRDILNGDHLRQYARKKVEDLLAQKKIILQYKDNNPLLPQFTLSEELKDTLKYPWERALIVKALGRNVGYHALAKRVKDIWKPRADLDIVILGFGYCLVKFDCDKDRERVILDGPWTVQGHYLTIRPWLQEFFPSAAFEESTMAWVRFPQLNLMYYNEEVLFAIASSIRKPIKIDVNTSLTTRGRWLVSSGSTGDGMQWSMKAFM